ncbi:hypothetical protein [Caenimonas koreensis]|uniref:hypothetical protein n=1 Tax=Caenimonas koreensis TaxID=367474 RepID=UPI003782F936
MRSVVVFLLFSLTSTLACAEGLGANDIRYVDRLSIDRSGSVWLLLVIDRPLEDGLTKPRTISKLNAYASFVKSGQFRTSHPEAKPELGVRLTVLHPAKRNALGASVLEQLAAHCKTLGFAALFQQIEEKEK